jgi:hypothetical protein
MLTTRGFWRMSGRISSWKAVFLRILIFNGPEAMINTTAPISPIKIPNWQDTEGESWNLSSISNSTHCFGEVETFRLRCSRKYRVPVQSDARSEALAVDLWLDAESTLYHHWFHSRSTAWPATTCPEQFLKNSRHISPNQSSCNYRCHRSR